jgi:hypothetical protein
MSENELTELQLSFPIILFAMNGNQDMSLGGTLPRSSIYCLLFGIIPDENDKDYILIKSLDGVQAVDGPLIKGQGAEDPAFKARQAYTFDEFVKYFLFNESSALRSSGKGTVPIGKLKGSLERVTLGALFNAASKRSNMVNKSQKTHSRALRVVQSKIKILDRTLNATEQNSGTGEKSLWLEVDAEGRIPFTGTCLQVLTEYAKIEKRKADYLVKVFEANTLVFDTHKDSKVPIKKLLKSIDGSMLKDYYSDDNTL